MLTPDNIDQIDKDILYDLLYEADEINTDMYTSNMMTPYEGLVNILQENIIYKYIIEHKDNIDPDTWPLIKQALILNPDLMMYPPTIIQDLTDISSKDKYSIYAQHALSHRLVNDMNVQLPEIDI